ncbi:MAG: T9SS type A sorting domain-containing protein [Bacteroidia bacterium]
MKKTFILAMLLSSSTVLLAQSQKQKPFTKERLQPENAANLAYQFNLSTAPFEFLTGATNLTGNMVWDDPTIPINLPFSFSVMGMNFNQIILDGLGGTLMSENMTTMEEIILAPFGADIIDRGYDVNTPLSPISLKIEGTAPNRIAKLEWKEVGSFDEYITTGGTLAMYISFQMWLYEGSNVIEYRFGANTITNPILFYEGETGAYIGMAYLSNTSNTSNLLNGPAANPSLSTMENAIVGTPPAATVYRFTPATSSVAEKALAHELKMYPNPANHLIHFQYNGEQNSKLSIRNMSGQLVKEIALYPGSQSADISELAAGVYLVQLEGHVGSFRLLKQ